MGRPSVGAVTPATRDRVERSGQDAGGRAHGIGEDIEHGLNEWRGFLARQRAELRVEARVGDGLERHPGHHVGDVDPLASRDLIEPSDELVGGLEHPAAASAAPPGFPWRVAGSDARRATPHRCRRR